MKITILCHSSKMAEASQEALKSNNTKYRFPTLSIS